MLGAAPPCASPTVTPAGLSGSVKWPQVGIYRVMITNTDLSWFCACAWWALTPIIMRLALMKVPFST